jgi:hypothetical protein
MIVAKLEDTFSTKDINGVSRDLSTEINDHISSKDYLLTIGSHELENNRGYTHLDGKKYPYIFMSLQRSILDDFSKVYGEMYIPHAVARFGKKRYVDVKYNSTLHNYHHLASRKNLVFNPDSNTYILFFNKAKNIIYAINDVFIDEGTPPTDAVGKPSWEKSRTYRPMTLNKLLTGKEGDIPEPDDIKPYVSFDEGLARVYSAASEFVNSIHKESPGRYKGDKLVTIRRR